MDLYCTPRLQVVHQARQVRPCSFSLPDSHFQGAGSQVGVQARLVEVCQPMILREFTSVTKAT